MKRPLYRILGNYIGALHRCQKSLQVATAPDQKAHWENMCLSWKTQLQRIEENYFPHGSGFDGGVSISENSTNKKILLDFSFHHMNEIGFYDGYSNYSVVVTPAFETPFDIKIQGRDYNSIKEYFYDLFDEILNREIDDTNLGGITYANL